VNVLDGEAYAKALRDHDAGGEGSATETVLPEINRQRYADAQREREKNPPMTIASWLSTHRFDPMARLRGAA
jgi:hypothetical protein